MSSLLGNLNLADILSLPNDIELLAAVGRIAMAHGKLDYVLRLMIKTVGKIRLDEARDGTKRLSSNELRKRVKKVAEKQFDDVVVLTRLEALLLRAEKVTEKRNRLIHDITYHTKSGEFVLQEDNDPHKPYPDAEELGKLSEEIIKVASELNSARKSGGFIGIALQQKAS